MEGMRARNLIRCSRDMGSVVVAVAGSMMAVRKNSQVALGVSRGDFGSRPHMVECLLAGVEPQVSGLLLDAAYAFSAGVAAAAIIVDCGMIRNLAGAQIDWLLTLGFADVLVLVLAVATFTFGVVGFGLARAATVLALLNRTALGVDVV